MSIHAYNLFSSNPPPFPLLQFLPCPPPTFPSIFMCTLSLIPLSPFSVPVCAHVWDHLLSGTTSVMKTDSPLQYPLLQALLHPCWDFSWLEFIYAVPASVSSRVQLPCHVLQILFSEDICSLWLLQSFCSLFHDDFWALEGRGVVQMFSLGLSTLKSLILWMLTSYGSLY